MYGQPHTPLAYSAQKAVLGTPVQVYGKAAGVAAMRSCEVGALRRSV